MTDIVLDLPDHVEGNHGLWPSVVPVSPGPPPPENVSVALAQTYYRSRKITFATLWEETPSCAVYRPLHDVPGIFSGDWRKVGNGLFELVGVCADDTGDLDRTPVGAGTVDE